MTREERERILSNDYANGIVEYNRDDSFMDQYKDDPLTIIDDKFGVVYVSFSKVSTPILWENGYAVIPKLFGLMDSVNVDAMGVNRVRGFPRLNLQGSGVLLGFVDTGIDYTNPAFQNADKTTRIASIWDQTIENLEAPETTFYYGTEYSREQINQALQSEDPFSIVPSKDDNGHGTMLAGIAGGSRDEENDFEGVVPLAEFMVVKLKGAKKYLRDYFYIPDDATCFQQDDIMFGIQYLVDRAAELNKPIVICIGLGSNQGPHEGSEIISEYISSTGNFTGRAIMVAAGNEGMSRKHYYGTIDPATGYNAVELSVGENEKGLSMELWGYPPGTYSIDILSPSGEYIPQITARLGESREIRFLFESTVIYVDYLVIESQSGDPFILVRFVNPAPGIWKFKVYGQGAPNMNFHIWLPIKGFVSDDTYFLNSNPETTITSPGNALLAVTVTAYNATSNSIYLNSSQGYTKNGFVKPDLAAPGVDVLAPLPDNQYTRVSGTSVATAHATGIAAMVFEWGIVRGNYYSISGLQMQRFLIRGASVTVRNGYPNKVWGYGPINIYNTFISLRSTLR